MHLSFARSHGRRRAHHREDREFSGSIAAWLAAAVLSGGLSSAAQAQSIEELKRLSVEDLGRIEVTSVSKRPEPLSDAAAAVYVISHDDIIRSGASTIPEMLRLAPNLRGRAAQCVGLCDHRARLQRRQQRQQCPNKLLVLIDGRSVYTPLFAGVYWDMQDVLPEDIERIEVISGPAEPSGAPTRSTASSTSSPATRRRRRADC